VAAAVPDPPPFAPEQEIRYALVLFGGVSLAIYINGVVQEFFRLVQSTAPEWPLATDVDQHRAWFPLSTGGRDGVLPLKNSERVYRMLGQLLPDNAPPDGSIRTRFVVDILSGTSAGGINGIVLAKALANRQSIDELRKLWVEDGDVGVLLNDSKSYEDLSRPALEVDLKPQRPPRSLLNGYRLLVRAFQTLRGMDGTEQGGESEVSPSYAEQLDLAVTATDLQGLQLPIKLYDGVVHEKRHKNVFRFAYWTKEATGTERNDFKDNDAMLAFAARCTSSFPFAFEPMVLRDLADVLPATEYPGIEDPFPQFFGDYRRIGTDYRGYAFADGGYLDNKPFTHASDQLRRRRADVPVERKLIYIEPDPSDPVPPGAPPPAPKPRPEVFENIAAAAMALPRSEPIREDIEAVVRRSRAITRLRSVTTPLIDAATLAEVQNETAPALVPEGSGLAVYGRLRRRVVLDDLADLLARGLGIAEESDGQYAIRLVVEAWADETDLSNAELFASYDLGFRLRRLAFVQQRINDLLRRSGSAARVLEELGLSPLPTTDARLLRQMKIALNEISTELRWRGRGARHPQRTAEQLSDQPEKTRANPETIEDDIERFEAVAAAVEALEVTEDALVAAILDPDPGEGLIRSEGQARSRATDLARERLIELKGVADALTALFALPFAAAEAAAALVLGSGSNAEDAGRDEAVRWLLRPGEEPTEEPALLHAARDLNEPLRKLLRGYYESFERVDALVLPLTYPDLGEVNPVDVIRISPLDARSLINEAAETRRKLSGTTVHHFGGFLDEGFRVNDILWGRLDGAERIIETALPPTHAEKAVLVEAAHLGIIREELLGESREEWVRTAVREHGAAATRSGASLVELREILGDWWTDDRLQEALAVQDHLAEHFTAPTEMGRREMLDVIGRGMSITSDVVGAAADSTKSARKPVFWVGRLGRLLTGLAALATRPRASELPRTMFRNVAVIAFVAGIALILLGLLGLEDAHKIGWTILAITAVAQIAVWLTTAWVGAPSRRPGASWRWKWFVRFAVGLIAVLTVVLAAIGLDRLIDKITN
jgi:patatin-related protein